MPRSELRAEVHDAVDVGGVRARRFVFVAACEGSSVSDGMSELVRNRYLGCAELFRWSEAPGAR